MATFYIVRHGNTFDRGEIILRVGARTDLPLSTSGQRQAEALATLFADTLFTHAVSSNLKRTRETAAAILGEQNFEIEPFLKEIDYGPDEGKPEDEVIARIGQDAISAWDRDATPPPGWHVDPDAIRQDWRTFLDRFGPDDIVLVVTSNGTARLVLDVVDTGDICAERKLRTGSYGIVETGTDGAVLKAWNIRP